MDAARDLTNVTLDGRYRLTRLLGEGGMGQVYEGVHELLDRKVAVKVLLPRYAYDARFRERFLREAKAASKVRHPNVVQILDFGDTPQGSVYIAMEFLEGRDLQTMLRDEGRLPWARARHLLLQITSAIGAAHERSVIHRDIKPANFVVINARGHQEFVKALDFGIAKIATEAGADGAAQNLTGTGEVFGTAKYMAPEQAFGTADDPRVDVYSVGVVAYEMLTGRVPFAGATAFEILTRHVNEPPQPLCELDPSIPREVEAVVLYALGKRPQDRYSTIDELGTALEAIPASAPGAGTSATFYGGAYAPQPVTPRPSAPLPASDGRPAAGVPMAMAVVPSVGLPGPAGLASPSGPPSAVTMLAPASTAAPPGYGPVDPVSDATMVVPAPMGAVDPSGPLGLDSSSMGGASSSSSMTPPVPATDPHPRMGSAAAPETDPHAVLSPAVSSRNKGLVVGLVATLLVAGAAVLAGVVVSSGDGVDPKAKVADRMQSRRPVEGVAMPLPGSPSAPPPAMGEALEVEAEVEPDESDAEPKVEVEPDLVEPEPEPEPEPEDEPEEPSRRAPSTKTASPPPLTDGRVKSRLSRKLERTCKAEGSSSVRVDLVIGSDGKVIGKTIQGVPSSVRSCLIEGLAGAKFPEGGLRKVSFSVDL